MPALGAALAAPASAPAACELNLILIPCLEATFPANASLGTLVPGTTTTSSEQVITVSSNQSWGMTIASDLVDGRMKEWNGSAYVTGSPKILADPLRWGLLRIGATPQTPSYAALSSSAATVVSNRPQTGCVLGLTCGTVEIGVGLRQVTHFADTRATPNSYRLRVTYVASHGF